MIIRKAETADYGAIYNLGSHTPEFQVSSSGPFMEQDELLSAIENTKGVFLVAESDSTIIGFVYASGQDLERGPRTKWACLVYLVVAREFRKRGIAQKLYDACITELKHNGINHVYGWANLESDKSIINFMEKNGFSTGHHYVWMDKKI